MRLKVHKLTETTNNHRKTDLLTTAKHGQLGAPPWQGAERGLQAISERTQPPAEPPAVTAPTHPADGSSASAWFAGLGKLCQRGLGWEGLGCVKSSSSAWKRPGLCCAVLCKGM